eukprot:TRINITY_DN4657_c0_g1_i3.p1 TRINITY_DN4657_c0_g1~~TRINITY_DN4657_c0_g1_i3.p1  ORF type:complete len:422 (-),score=35.19 TRINITY_DN4657_c0_g1_i3:1317-2582(-)
MCFATGVYSSVLFSPRNPKVQPKKLVSTKLPKQIKDSPTQDKWSVLQRLTRDQKYPDTVYVVRLHTGQLVSRPSAVNLCLVSEDGTSILHRVQSVYEHKTPQEQMQEICSVVGSEAGAACALVLNNPQKKIYTGGPIYKERFRSDRVDEVVFVGPELGKLAGILVGPESGAWVLDEVEVTSSRSQLTHHFLCQDRLGAGGTSAAYLTPIPANAVVYGRGNSAIVLTNPFVQSALNAVSIASENKLVEFDAFENRIPIACAALTVLGFGLLTSTGCYPDATVFAFYSTIGAAVTMGLESFVTDSQTGWVKTALSRTSGYSPQSNTQDFGNLSEKASLLNKEATMIGFFFRLAMYTSFLLSFLYLASHLELLVDDPNAFVADTKITAVSWFGALHYFFCRSFLSAQNFATVNREASVRQRRQA